MQVVQYEILDVHIAENTLWKDIKELEPPSYAEERQPASVLTLVLGHFLFGLLKSISVWDRSQKNM